MKKYLKAKPVSEQGALIVERTQKMKEQMRWEICEKCSGDGKSSAYLGAITQEDREQDWSEEEWEGYMAGAYDRKCEKCKGTGKVKVVDFPKLSKAEKKAYRELQKEEAAYEAMCRMELRSEGWEVE